MELKKLPSYTLNLALCVSQGNIGTDKDNKKLDNVVNVIIMKKLKLGTYNAFTWLSNNNFISFWKWEYSLKYNSSTISALQNAWEVFWQSRWCIIWLMLPVRTVY